MNTGRIRRAHAEPSFPVSYSIAEVPHGEFRGTLSIEPYSEAGGRFLKNASSACPSAVNYTLETTCGVDVTVQFIHPDGSFRCLNPSEARAALIVSGERGPLPGEVVSLLQLRDESNRAFIKPDCKLH